jgi:transcriptional regulator
MRLEHAEARDDTLVCIVSLVSWFFDWFFDGLFENILMYIPKQFDVTDIAVISRLIEVNPLATIVTRQGDTLNANHIPLHLVEAGELGIASSNLMPGKMLRGHVARANPMWKDLESSDKALVVFVGVQAYISPSLYATKKVDAKVVPTWNYEAVHIHGAIRLIQDGPGLHALMHSLTDTQERSLSHPWSIDDAPAEYTERLMSAIVGIEISIDRIEAKRKLSQNQPSANQQSVVEGLAARQNPQDAAMAEAIRGAITKQKD